MKEVIRKKALAKVQMIKALKELEQALLDYEQLEEKGSFELYGIMTELCDEYAPTLFIG
jgi:hypothetical protein